MSQPTDKIKELRQRTSAGMMDCKRALEETGGDIEKAIDVLRKKGIAKAAKKAERATSAGVIDAYIHPGERLGVLIEVDSETDFVSRNPSFRGFVRDLAMHVAATDPVAVDRDSVAPAVVEREKRIYAEQAAESGKPPQIAEKIATGKLEKFFADNCLLEQPFVKTPDRTVGDYVKEQIAKFGENIRVRRFTRFKVGE